MCAGLSPLTGACGRCCPGAAPAQLGPVPDGEPGRDGVAAARRRPVAAAFAAAAARRRGAQRPLGDRRGAAAKRQSSEVELGVSTLMLR